MGRSPALGEAILKDGLCESAALQKNSVILSEGEREIGLVEGPSRLYPSMIKGGQSPRHEWLLRRLVLDGNTTLMPVVLRRWDLGPSTRLSVPRLDKVVFSFAFAQDDGSFIDN